MGMWGYSGQGSSQSPLPRTYIVTQAPPTTRFSKIEIEHILIAFSVLTFDFWLLESGLTGLDMFASGGTPTGNSLILAVPLALLVAATGFLSHEMAHKFVARSMGLWSEFRMFLQTLFLSVITAFVGILYAAPGATFIDSRGPGKTREMGISSVAGPLMNLSWTGAFLGVAVLGLHLHLNDYWVGVCVLVAFVNSWFALFNMIPWGPLDGRKVMHWNKGLFVLTLLASIGAFVGMAILAYGYNF